MRLLDSGCDAARLRAMSPAELTQLAGEIRELLVNVVAARGGHLGSNLGVVELTIALHRVFDSPRDRILFDTGHQSYVHKLLTGRLDGFSTLRTKGGLSGYSSRTESVHDVIENSHASTALSYADGLARAYGPGRAVVAVVGDGALTGGMAWEALNNLGAAQERNVVVVLNDNGRSYSPTIGGLAAHLADGEATVFGNLGLEYLGPVDGHDIRALEQVLAQARSMSRPVVVHVRTRKGNGYAPAEADEDEKFHAPGVFDPATGERCPAQAASWTGVFAEEMLRVGAQQPEVVALTAAMLGPTGLTAFAQAFPDRLIDVGIAEQHAAASAAGLAMGGRKPVVALYATFLNRAFDQLLLDVALHRLGVTFVLDRAGITGDDGPSHNGMWDLSILQVVPGLDIAAPRDANSLRELLAEAISITDRPTVVRFPKGSLPPPLPAIGQIGGADLLYRSGTDVLLIVAGALAHTGVEAAGLLHAQGVGTTVVDPRWVKPLDSALAAAAREHRLVVVLEDNCRAGGVGDAVARLLRDSDVDTPVRSFGVSVEFPEHAKRAEILARLGLTSRDVARAVTEFLAKRTPARWPLPLLITAAETEPVR